MARLSGLLARFRRGRLILAFESFLIKFFESTAQVIETVFLVRLLKLVCYFFGQFARFCIDRGFECALLLVLLGLNLLHEELALFARFAFEEQVVLDLGEWAAQVLLPVYFWVECGFL